MATMQSMSPRRPTSAHVARLRALIVALLAVQTAISAGCRPDIRRFPLSDPLWEDPDRNHVPKRPGKHYSGLMADGADQMFFRPLAKLFWFPLPGEARNVNAVDEVPNSSWFTNRIGLHPYTPAEAARGV